MMQVFCQLFQAQRTGSKDAPSCSVHVHKQNNFCARGMMKGHVLDTDQED